MANWRPPTPKVWRFRIRGISGDGTTVTLGRFESEAEAKAEYNRLVEEGYYKKLSLKPVEPPAPTPPADAATAPAPLPVSAPAPTPPVKAAPPKAPAPAASPPKPTANKPPTAKAPVKSGKTASTAKKR